MTLDLEPEIFGIAATFPLKEKCRLSSKSSKDRTVIEVKGKKIGSNELFIIAVQTGTQALRGGAFKPRTSPYEFQGLGIEGLKTLRNVGQRHNLITISEVMDASQINLVASFVDILQI